MIPDGWKRKILGEIADISSGSTPLRQKDEYWNQGTIPWVTTGEIDYQIIESAKEKITELALKECSLKIYDRGTILMAMYGQGITRGRIALLGINAATNQACCAISVNSSANTKFIYFQLEHLYSEIRKLGHGGNQQNLNGQIIKQIPIMFPPLLEQCRIAEILGVWDESIDLLERLIGRVRSRKQGLMQQLLTGKKRFKEFEGSEWKTVELSKLFTLTSGKTKPKNIAEHSNGNKLFPVYGGNGIIGYTDIPLVNNPNFIVGRVGEYCGTIRYVSSSCWITDNALYAKAILSNISVRFMVYKLQHFDLSKLRTKGGQPLISQEPIYSSKVSIPSLPEQEKIADVLSAADEEISTLEKQLAAYKQQKLGLMQQLLTGRIRI
jgi:type I restriction enzyme, S subunit